MGSSFEDLEVSLVPRLLRGNMKQVCIPTQERGNEKEKSNR